LKIAHIGVFISISIQFSVLILSTDVIWTSTYPYWASDTAHYFQM